MLNAGTEPGTFRLEPVSQPLASLSPNEQIDNFIEFCVDYAETWSVAIDVQVTPPPSLNMQSRRRLSKRDEFVQDWSAGYCRCLNMRALNPNSDSLNNLIAASTSPATATGAADSSESSQPTENSQPGTTQAAQPSLQPTTTVVAAAPTQQPDYFAPPPPPAVPTTTTAPETSSLTTETETLTSTTSFTRTRSTSTIGAAYTTSTSLAPNSTIYESDYSEVKNFGQTLSDCLTAVNRNESLSWAVYLPGPMACFGSRELFFEAQPGYNGRNIGDNAQAFKKKTASTYTTKTGTPTTSVRKPDWFAFSWRPLTPSIRSQITRTTSTRTRTMTQSTSTTCRPINAPCTFDWECCYHSSGGTSSQTGGSICFDAGGGSGKVCSGPKCSSGDFTQCGLCLDNCGTSNKVAVCQSYNTSLGSSVCSNVNGNQGGGRCRG